MKTLTKRIGKKLHILAVMVAAGLISLNLYSQKSIKHYELEKYTEDLINKSTEQIKSAFARSSSFNPVFDNVIGLEDWMTDLNQWMILFDSDSNMKEGPVPENAGMSGKGLTFESWMLRTNWSCERELKNFNNSLEFEGWMLKPFELTASLSDNNSGRK